MKRFSSIVFLLAMVCGVFAQAESDARAKAIVDKAVAQLRTPQQYEFTTTYTAGHSGEKHVQHGICAVNGKKNYVKFGGLETFFDGKTQWVFMPDNNEVSISEPTLAEQREVNPLLMVNDYAQTHRVAFDEATDADAYLLCLYPTVAAKVDYFRIKLAIDKKTSRLVRLEFDQRNADRILLTIDAQKPLPNGFSFTFDQTKHPYVDVNDLR